MSAAEILEELRRMPEAERRELVDTILFEFKGYNDELTREQIAELDRRAEEFRKNPEVGIPWKTVQAELHERLKTRNG